MRSLFFNLFFYLATFIYVLSCLVFSLLPGRRALMAALRRYTKVMLWGMRRIGGMDIRISGHDNIPVDGPVIIASKHQSYGDGFVIFSQFDDLSFVAGNHLEKFWGLKRILTKMNAVVIDNCGGSDSQAKMEQQAADVRRDGRRLLIFPEGHLSKVGTRHRYRKGVWHFSKILIVLSSLWPTHSVSVGIKRIGRNLRVKLLLNFWSLFRQASARMSSWRSYKTELKPALLNCSILKIWAR